MTDSQAISVFAIFMVSLWSWVLYTRSRKEGRPVARKPRKKKPC